MPNWIVMQKSSVDLAGAYHGEIPAYLVCDVPEGVELTIETVKKIYQQSQYEDEDRRPEAVQRRERYFQEIFAPIEHAAIYQISDESDQEIFSCILRFGISDVLFWDSVDPRDKTIRSKKDAALAQLKQEAIRIDKTPAFAGTREERSQYSDWVVTQKDYTDYDGEYQGEVPNFLVVGVPDTVNLNIEIVRSLWWQANPRAGNAYYQQSFQPVENGGIYRADEAIKVLGAKINRFQINCVLFWDEIDPFDVKSTITRKNMAQEKLKELFR